MLSFFSNPTSGLTAAALALAAVCVGVGVLRLQQFRTATSRDLSREERARLRELEAMRRSLAELMEQIERTVRESDQAMNERLAQMRSALAQADARIARLNGLSTESTESAENAKMAERPEVASVAESAERLEPVAEAGNSCEVRAEDETEPVEDVSTATVFDDSMAGMRRDVCELADAGRTPLEIARRTGLALGEVELILNLRRAA